MREFALCTRRSSIVDDESGAVGAYPWRYGAGPCACCCRYAILAVDLGGWQLKCGADASTASPLPHLPPAASPSLPCSSAASPLFATTGLLDWLKGREEKSRKKRCGPHNFFFTRGSIIFLFFILLTRMSRQRNQRSILLWNPNCTVLYS